MLSGNMKTIISLWLLFSTILSSTIASNLSNANHEHHARAPTGSKTVIIQMFEWNWDSIAAECTNFIGPAGYGYIQVSPPQEHITGSQWWTDYQPVSYILTSKRGNRSQFQNMVNTCHSAGVKVIADTLFNHMAGIDSGTGTAGSTFTHYNYPGIYQIQDFHHCGRNGNDDISNYNDRQEVQTCELVNLADLATDTEYVRGKLAQFANDLLSLGVDGFRLDAAKHIPATDIANILGRLTRQPYITQEVIQGSGEPIQPSEYLGNGDVQEFRYVRALRTAFLSGGISSLQNLDSQGWVSGTKANVFVANHDTERNGDSLNINSASNTYITATIFSLAHPYGTPTILSSYKFTNNDDGAPNNGAGACTTTGGSGNWLCQHRYIAINGMVGFRNIVGSAGLVNWFSPESQRIAFGRGSLGFVAINNVDSAWTSTFTTSLPAGTYCDVVGGKLSSGSCTAAAITVSGGSFTATVAPRSAIAIHAGSLVSAGVTGTTQVTFEETATVVAGEVVYLTGNVVQTGTWSGASSGYAVHYAKMAATGSVWKITIALPSGATFQYKFLKRRSGVADVVESDPDRSATIATSGSQTLTSTWR